MWGSVIFGICVGFAAYVAMGGQDYWLMLAILPWFAVAGVGVGMWITTRVSR